MEKLEADNSNFEALSKQLTEEERKDLLDRMGEETSPVATYNKEDVAKNIILNSDDSHSSLISQLNQESIFKKFILWLKAAFSNLSIETVYNQSLVKQIAKDIEHNFIGLISYKQKLFLDPFYEKLSELNTAYEFFSKYLESVKNNDGRLYVRLGFFLMNDYQNEIQTETDPYQFPLDQTASVEQRGQLLVKLESKFANIPASGRSQMYACARGLEWLKQFCALDITSMLRKFRYADNGTYDCMFNQLRTDFADFIKVLSCEVDFSDDLFRAIYSVYQQEHEEVVSSISDSDEFLNKVKMHVALINSFRTIIPLKKLGKVVFENATYVPETMGGSENWFVKYKEEWRKIFDARWNEYLGDVKKEVIKRKLTAYFGLQGLPQLPSRPWIYLPGSVHHKYENIAGFIYWFVKNQFKNNFKILNTLLLEGDFLIKDNNAELMDVISSSEVVKEDVDILCASLDENGEYGSTIKQYAGEPVLSSIAVQKLNAIQAESSKTVETIVEKFGKICRSIDNILSGVLGFSITTYHAGITNFHKIQGIENKKFIEKLEDCYYVFKYAYEVLVDLESLENMEIK